ncbi:LytTR family two component transcriptional regulator [Chitinophaga niastensis]|uniref:LytTR family two component transcriptional regulator n=1 Tax=Chitinophaga niastensis TaxID=536980 RepID=A0A2P8HCR3_CHINA|nr:response regulator [Chitinophaga niastensis]PSL43901.1 LytTR family two component transcriptional regulator [Chitinophaga niastensis]
MKKIQVIIIDDERSAREEIKRALAPYPDFEVTGEAKNADEAKELIETKKPDLIFLDIQMPEKSGFDLLASLEDVPEVIFTTAYDQYALQAFDNNALDYLMKPIREERFTRAIEKIRKQFTDRATTDRRIFVKDRDQCFFIPLSDIYLIESVDNYARLYFNEKKVLLKSSLNQLEEKLDATIFFRINRTQLINAGFIAQIHAMPGGKLQISLQQGMRLEVSSRQSVKFKNWHTI